MSLPVKYADFGISTYTGIALYDQKAPSSRSHLTGGDDQRVFHYAGC